MYSVIMEEIDVNNDRITTSVSTTEFYSYNDAYKAIVSQYGDMEDYGERPDSIDYKSPWWRYAKVVNGKMTYHFNIIETSAAIGINELEFTPVDSVQF